MLCMKKEELKNKGWKPHYFLVDPKNLDKINITKAALGFKNQDEAFNYLLTIAEAPIKEALQKWKQ